jgi:hypothetical protein
LEEAVSGDGLALRLVPFPGSIDERPATSREESGTLHY